MYLSPLPQFTPSFCSVPHSLAMGNCKISSDLKNIAIELWYHGWDRSDICNLLHHFQSNLYHWLAIYKLFGSMENRLAPLCGHPRVIGLAALEAIHQVYAWNPATYLDGLQWYLVIHHDLPVSISALQDNLQKAGLTWKVLHKIAAEADENWKMLFRAGIKNPAHFTGTGVEFLVIDESLKDERTWAWHYGRSLVGANMDLSDVFVWGECYSLIAALTTEGYIATWVQMRSFDSFGFFDFIVDDLVHNYGLVMQLFHWMLWQLPYMNSYPNEHSVLMMDNCHIHHTDTLLDVVNAAGMSLLFPMISAWQKM